MTRGGHSSLGTLRHVVRDWRGSWPSIISTVRAFGGLCTRGAPLQVFDCSSLVWGKSPRGAARLLMSMTTRAVRSGPVVLVPDGKTMPKARYTGCSLWLLIRRWIAWRRAHGDAAPAEAAPSVAGAAAPAVVVDHADEAETDDEEEPRADAFEADAALEAPSCVEIDLTMEGP